MKNGIMQNPTERLTSTKENEHQKENSHVDLPSRKLNGLDLFSGIGGITKALDEWVQPVAYSENERYCQGTLLSRISTGDLPNAPIWDDVRTLTANHLPRVDVVYGGFPCQDISVANTSGTGLAGKRSGLFFEIERLIREIRPRFVFLENVPAIRTRGGSIVGARLADAGYDCRWVTLSASEVGANHQRKRWFLLAKSHGISRGAIKESEKQTGETWRESIGNSSTNVADPDSNREKRDQPEDGGRGGIVKNDWWAIEPNVGRVVARLSSWLDDFKIREEKINAHKGCIKKAKSKGFPQTEAMRKLWEVGNSKTSSKLSRCFMCGVPLPDVPQENTPFAGDVGEWKEEVEGVHHLREGIHALYLLQKYYLWPRLQVHSWQTKCEQTVEERINRLKCLGNSVCPSQAKEAFKILMGI